MAEKKVNKMAKKSIKKVVISALMPLLISILIASLLFAILQAILEIIMKVVKALLDGICSFLKNPIKWGSAMWGTFSNWLDRTFGAGEKFNPNAYEDKRDNFDATIVITQEQFDQMIHGKVAETDEENDEESDDESYEESDEDEGLGLDQAIERDAYGVGLDDFSLKKMLLAYYRGIYFDDTNILIELKKEEVDDIMIGPWSCYEVVGVGHMITVLSGTPNSEKIAPFSVIGGDADKCLGEDKKVYLKARGMIDAKLQGKSTDLIYYPEDMLTKIYEKEYIGTINKGRKDYANSVLEYLGKCYTYNDTGIKMYMSITNATFDYMEYCNDGIPQVLETSNSDVIVQFYDISYHEKVLQFATPLEFMTALTEVTGSQEFVNKFIEMVGISNRIEMELNEVIYEEKTEEVTNAERDITIKGSKENDEEEDLVYKEITDKSKVITSKTKLYKEKKYDLVVKRVITWYGEITRENKEKTVTTYTTIDQEGNEISISSDSEKVTTNQDNMQIVYTGETNPDVFNDINLEQEYSKLNSCFGDAANEVAEKYVNYLKNLYFSAEIDENGINWLLNSGVLQAGWHTLEKSEEYCLARQYNYIKKKPQGSYESYEEYIKQQNEINAYTFNEMSVNDSQITKSTLKTITNTTYIQTNGIEKDTTDLFLALLSGNDDKYELGDTFKAKKNGGVVVKYKSLYGKDDHIDEQKVGAGEMLENGAQVLFELLERSPNTQGLVEPMKYIMYRYSGIDYGVTEFTFEIFDPSAFNVQPKAGTTLLIEYIHELEGTTNVKLNADESKYVIYKDSAGNLIVGYGVNITSGGYEALFEKAGYSLEEGIEVEKEFVDNLEEEELGNLVEQVREKTKKLDLKEYQIHALTVKARDCGITETFGIKNGKTFEQAYNEYWKEATDNLFKKKNNSADFNHNLYKEYMSKPESNTEQRKSEWILFQTGYYNKIDTWYPDTGEMLEKCVEVMNDLLANNVRYSKTDLVWNNIEASNDFSKYSCVCCTYVTAVIYRAGILPADYINRYNYHTPGGVNNMLEKAGWTLVNASEAQPGDIGTFTISKSGDKEFRHGFIYAGGNEIWDQSSGCISTDGTPPKRGTKSNWSYYVNNAGNLKVWRMP